MSLELSSSTNSSILGERSSSLEEKWSNHVAVAGHQAGAKDGQEGLIEPAATAPQEDAETEEQQARGIVKPNTRMLSLKSIWIVLTLLMNATHQFTVEGN